MASNPYELLGRERKVARLVDALDADLGHAATVADLAALSNDGKRLNRILAKAKIKDISDTSVDALVERIQQRDAKFQEAGR